MYATDHRTPNGTNLRIDVLKKKQTESFLGQQLRERFANCNDNDED